MGHPLKVQNSKPGKVSKKGMISSTTGRQQYLQIPQFFRALKLADWVDTFQTSCISKSLQVINHIKHTVHHPRFLVPNRYGNFAMIFMHHPFLQVIMALLKVPPLCDSFRYLGTNPDLWAVHGEIMADVYTSKSNKLRQIILPQWQLPWQSCSHTATISYLSPEKLFLNPKLCSKIAHSKTVPRFMLTMSL